MLELCFFPRRSGREDSRIPFGRQRAAGFVVEVIDFEESVAVFGQTWIPFQSENMRHGRGSDQLFRLVAERLRLGHTGRFGNESHNRFRVGTAYEKPAIAPVQFQTVRTSRCCIHHLSG